MRVTPAIGFRELRRREQLGQELSNPRDIAEVVVVRFHIRLYRWRDRLGAFSAANGLMYVA